MTIGSAAVISTHQFFNGNGKPLFGGLLYTYLAGTTTNTTTWSDAALTVANTNPVVLDADGRCSLFFDDSVVYKLVLKSSTGVTQWTADYQRSQGNVPQLKSDLASSSGSSLIGFTQSGTGAVSRSVESKLRDVISVKDFGAISDGSDNSSYFQTAIIACAAAGGGTVFVPAGTYFINTTLTIPSNVVLKGAGRGSTILRGAGANYTATTHAVVGSGVGVIGIYMNGHNSEVTALTVQEFGCGIYMNTAYWSKVYLARMTACRMGLRCYNGFISSVFENNMDYNKFNVVLQGESYALTLYANDIDNQIQYSVSGNTVRAPGLFITGDNGAIIRDNVIESGSADVGSGIIIAGGITQRTVITGNWFEQNGSGIYSCDIALGLPNNALGTALASSLPEEYSITVPSAIYSNVEISDNFHFASKYGIIGTFFFDRLNVSISNETFVGIKNRGNQPIVLFTNSAGTGNTRFYINNCTVWNSQDDTINAEMLSGVKNSYVFTGAGFDNYNYGFTTLDGVDLFTKEMTMYEFSQMPGATFNVEWRVPTSGVATASNQIRAQIGTHGVKTTATSGRLRLGSVGVLNVGVPFTGVVIASPGSQANWTYSGGGAGFLSTASNSANIFAVYTGTQAATDSEVTLSTGEYYGYCFLSTADGLAYLQKCTRVKITDLDLVPDKTVAESFPSDSAQSCSVGDIVYNSSPAAGGHVGWICTTAGTPGTWNTFGAITA